MTAQGPATDGGRQRREICETVVVVLILVSLLRIFAAEGFEIPSGSMATTLLGAHKLGKCPDCGFDSLVNARSEIEPTYDPRRQELAYTPVNSGFCQNCGHPLAFGKEGNQSPFTRFLGPLGRAFAAFFPGEFRMGDRVLVAKYWYDGVSEPLRWHIPVFKCPEAGNGTMNYIKRLVGLPNETIEIANGRLLVKPAGAKEFSIARRPPHVQLAVRRLVHDADFPPASLRQRGIVRWVGENGWTSDADGKAWRFDGKSAGKLTYQHRIGKDRIGGRDGLSLIDDVAAYNTDSTTRSADDALEAANLTTWSRQRSQMPHSGAFDAVAKANWVRDLMVECRLNVVTAAGTTSFELGAGARRYRLACDLHTGEVSLWQNDRKVKSTSTRLNVTGEHLIRFGDFDERLTVWIDGNLAFGDGFDVPESQPDEIGPYLSDFRPVEIAADRAEVAVRSLRVYRNTYYLQTVHNSDATLPPRQPNAARTRNVVDIGPVEVDVAEYRAAVRAAAQRPTRLTVAPNSYLMMGDNSPCSFDGRNWQTTNFVPRQNMLGRALCVYWPIWNVHLAR